MAYKYGICGSKEFRAQQGIKNSCNKVLVRGPVYVNVPISAPPLAKYPNIITFEGTEMVAGSGSSQIYTNPLLSNAVSVRVFASPLNRFLVAAEYTLSGNQIIIDTGATYISGDWFDVLPKWQ